MKRASFFAAAAVLVLSAACSGGTSSGGGGGGGTVTGTVGGKSFTIASGLGHVTKDGTLDVILSDQPGLCDAVQAQKFPAGLTIVQAYRLSGKAPGSFTPGEHVKYATVSASCPSGQPIEEKFVEKASDSTDAKITISTLTDTVVEGRIEATFADGSSVSGSFSVPICAQSEAEKATCS